MVPPSLMMPSTRSSVSGFRVAFHQALPALREADNFIAVIQQAQDGPANSRVQAGAVPAAGQHTDLHVCLMSSVFVSV